MASVVLRGSFHQHAKESTPAGSPGSSEPVGITVVIHRRSICPHPTLLSRELSHQEFEERYGADPAHLAQIERFATKHRLTMSDVNLAARTVKLIGTAETIARAFETTLEWRQTQTGTHLSYRGHLYLPAELAPCVQAVLGVETKPIARTRRILQPAAAALPNYTPPQVAELYNFPRKGKGKGQTIALIELGGGFRESDLKHYWTLLGFASDVPVVAVPVDGGANAPTGDANGPDGEVVLDIEVSGGVAPEATVAVYFAPNTTEGFLNAINAAIHDQQRKCSVISISWGGPEETYTEQALTAYNNALHDAALLGITVCAASGDAGSSDGELDRRAHVDFPASSPYVLACGGTRLVGHNGQIASEVAWHDASGGATGGGVSSYFKLPDYQKHAHVPRPAGQPGFAGRGVPDVAGVADPATGFRVFVDGVPGVVGGTSAVAPLWAGLIALLNEQLHRNVGFLNPTLYTTLSARKALHDVVSGTNGAYRASTGWDACTGLGSPNGEAILTVLQQLQPTK